MADFQHLPHFTTSAEVEHLRGLVGAHQDLFRETRSPANIGPRYRVIHGGQIRARLPELLTWSEQRIRPVVEQFAGEPLEPMRDVTRAIRIQVFAGPHHGFRWHFDGDSYAALLTLENTNGGQTHLVGAALSRVVRPLFYPLYWAPQLFSLLPHRTFEMPAGDLLILHGTRLLHRGVCQHDGGERLVVAFGYDEVGKRPNPLRERFARYVNFTE